MRRKKTAAMLPKPGPDPLQIGLGQVQSVQSGARKKLEASFTVRGRHGCQSAHYLKQEQQPMAPALIAVLADDPSQVQGGGRNDQAKLLLRFPAGAGVGRFTFMSVKFPTARAPEAEVGFLRPLQQQHVVLLIKAVEQGGDLIGQRHGSNTYRKRRPGTSATSEARQISSRGPPTAA